MGKRFYFKGRITLLSLHSLPSNSCPPLLSSIFFLPLQPLLYDLIPKSSQGKRTEDNDLATVTHPHPRKELELKTWSIHIPSSASQWILPKMSVEKCNTSGW